MATRLDKLVADKFGLSRRAAQDAVRNGKVDLGGRRCDEPGMLIEESAELTYAPNRPKARRVVGGGVEVLYEDADVIIANKPPGLLTLPTAQHEPDTLSSRVERYMHLRHGRKSTLGIIHRLDKDTSGALAFAKHQKALHAFQDLFQVHAIERQYLAVVEGTVTTSAGTIDAPLVIGGDNARHRVARAPAEGVQAVTHYRVVERFGTVATLVACWLETGRTHQIRLHLAHLGYPVVGDTRYRPPDRPQSKARFKRQALHAQILGFLQPLTGARVRVEAPFPNDLREWITDLRLRFGIYGAGG